MSTLKSIYEQTYDNVEIVIKDGLSTDTSVKELKTLLNVDGDSFATDTSVKELKTLRNAEGDSFSTDMSAKELKALFNTEGDSFATVYEGKKTVFTAKSDKGIYDAMNQAVEIWYGLNSSVDEGERVYCQFLNCGDVFYNKTVLEDMAEKIKSDTRVSDDELLICYGDRFNVLQGSVVTSSPKINDLALYRNVPCHQVCFYDYRLMADRGGESYTCYYQKYNVRGDYEHFLNCVYERGAGTRHMDIVICRYEGGGYSETPENRKKSEQQHREITRRYMGVKADIYRWIMILSGARIRTYLSESPVFAGVYNKIKSAIYGMGRK